MGTINQELLMWLQQMGVAEGIAQWLIRIGVMLAILLIIYVFDRICRQTVIPMVRKLTSKTQVAWDDYLLSDEVLNNACHLVPPVLLSVFLPMILPLGEDLMWLVDKVCDIYLIVIVLKLLCSVVNSLYAISNEHERMKDKSIKGFYQMLKLVIICIGVIIIVSTLLDKSPVVILTGLGAGAAILMLVFQDTIKGLVAGVQLAANDMVRPGDWIEMPKYGADGDVIEVSLTTVKVRNWDKTITTVPPYALVNDSFQNWRGMFESGGRRIKRSINIDMNTVRFCTPEEFASLKDMPWMKNFTPTGKKEVNLHIFRHYLEEYIRNHPKVNKEQTMMVRQLQPTAQGLPLELYFFSADTAWIKYEQLQAEVFDHLLAVMSEFGLKVFQSPTGKDFMGLNQ